MAPMSRSLSHTFPKKNNEDTEDGWTNYAEAGAESHLAKTGAQAGMALK